MSVIAVLYPNVAIQIIYRVSQKSVCESNMNPRQTDPRQTNQKNPGKLGEGKMVNVSTESKFGGCGSH